MTSTKTNESELLEAKALYMNSAEIHAAVNTVVNIAMRYKSRREQADDLDIQEDLNELYKELILFFATYDRARTDQVETLRSLLIGELYKTAKPTLTGVVPQ